MKNLKITVLTLALSGLAFTSCKDDKENNSREIVEVEMSSEMDSKLKQEAEDKTRSANSVSNKAMASINKVTTKDGITVERSINNTVNAMQISGWSGFNTLSIEMKKLEGADFKTIKAALPSVASTINSLNTTRPDWMKTEEISEDIEDLQKEYKELMSKDNTNDRKYKRDLEELNEAYDDLVEEINETFDKYVKINRKALEEYNEEIEDDGDLDDAREEYNEEIKKLNKVADDKGKK